VGCAAIQRVPDRLEIWADRNLMNFNQGKYKVLCLGRKNAMHQHTLGATQLESSLTENDLEGSGGHLVDNELAIYPCSEEG